MAVTKQRKNCTVWKYTPSDAAGEAGEWRMCHRAAKYRLHIRFGSNERGEPIEVVHFACAKCRQQFINRAEAGRLEIISDEEIGE